MTWSFFKEANSVMFGERVIRGMSMDSRTRVDIAFMTARVSTFVAVVLAAVVPVVGEVLDHHRLPEYDPGLAVLTATLIAIIWTAYHTFQGVQHARTLLEREDAQRERDARFYLEALAEEITQISAALKMVEKSPSLARFDYLSHPILVECMKRSDLFAPSTAVYMTRVASALRPLPGILQAYRQDPKDPAFHKTVIEIIKRTESTLSGLATNLINVLEGAGRSR